MVRALRAPAVRQTLLVILVLNLFVVAIKVVVGIRTNSLSVLGAALESSLDLINNIVGIALVRLAAIEPDEDHPYGHGKFETVGALGIVVFLSITCFELLREGVLSVMRGREPRPPSVLELSAIAGTMVINLFVVWYERRRASQLGSAFLMADAAHTQSDIYVTLAAVGSLLLTRAGWGFVDRSSPSSWRDHRMARIRDVSPGTGARRCSCGRCGRDPAARGGDSSSGGRALHPITGERIGGGPRRSDDRRGRRHQRFGRPCCHGCGGGAHRVGARSVRGARACRAGVRGSISA